MSRSVKPIRKILVQHQLVGLAPEVTEILGYFLTGHAPVMLGSLVGRPCIRFLNMKGQKSQKRTVTAEDRVLVSEITYSDVANSFLHRIGTRQSIFPYMDMIRWVIDHMNIAARNFMTHRQMVIDYFTAKYLSAMYHLPAA